MSQAKGICKFFLPERDQVSGKVRCYYLMADGEMCKRPDRYRCDVETVKRARDNPVESKPVSLTRINSWLNCQRKWALEYVYRQRVLLEAEWKVAGRAFASGRARLDAGESYTIDPQGFSETGLIKTEVVLEEYARRRESFGFPPLRSEQYVTFDFEGVRFGGYLDAISEDGTMIVEWKYALDDYDLLKTARQLAVYAHSLPTVQKLVVAVAHKSSHRLKKNEGLDAFKERLRVELAKDESLFTFATFDRAAINTDLLLHDMVVAHRQSQAAERSGEFVAALGSRNCENCEWAQLCLDHLTRPLGCDDCKHTLICNKVREVKVLGPAPVVNPPELPAKEQANA